MSSTPLLNRKLPSCSGARPADGGCWPCSETAIATKVPATMMVRSMVLIFRLVVGGRQTEAAGRSSTSTNSAVASGLHADVAAGSVDYGVDQAPAGPGQDPPN